MRLFSGTLKAGDRVLVMSTSQTYEIKEVGIFTPEMTKAKQLEEGVGYVIANIKDASEIQIGDTLTQAKPARSLTCLKRFIRWSSRVFIR